jgi:hypothetical protein
LYILQKRAISKIGLEYQSSPVGLKEGVIHGGPI